ncbi:hypothetical protein BpHYR1_048376 [Brachionus plicatilis]|uniref:Uncharacterized protein n=1 Tax=Brachionus plicatilis TaxID=10195 RepID=A0A3M7QFD3_BRAPC|nr:hypothetical protein BpHYR1_048376 [Brachionus plicatilis]
MNQIYKSVQNLVRTLRLFMWSQGYAVYFRSNFWMNQSPDFIENKLAPTFIEYPLHQASVSLVSEKAQALGSLRTSYVICVIGHGIHFPFIRDLASNYLITNKIPNRFKNNTPGKDWFYQTPLYGFRAYKR